MVGSKTNINGKFITNTNSNKELNNNNSTADGTDFLINNCELNRVEVMKISVDD